MKRIISLFSFLALFITGCRKPYFNNPNLELKLVYLESGNITKNTNGTSGFNQNVEFLSFVKQGPFNPTDKALGSKIKVETNSTCQANAYEDKFGNIFAFEGGTIPAAFQNINYANNQIYLAHWVKSYTYYLPQDALICDKNPVFSFRPAGYYLRKETVINSVKIYKIRNEEFTEDYSNFLEYHKIAQRTESQEVDLFGALSLNPANYDVVTSRAGLVVNGGKIKRALSTPTLANTIDKITFVPRIPNLEKFQLRVILLKKTTENEEFYNFFIRSENKENLSLNVSDEQMYNYLNSHFVSDFRLGIIRGYECISCTKNKNLRTSLKSISESKPPLPIIDP